MRIHRHTGRLHDGMWLLGNLIGGYDRAPDPAIPVGWLLSISLRHIHRNPSADEPAEAWDTAVKLAIDFTVSMDCQRYNRFDELFLDTPDFLAALQDSLTWREFFTLPQVPSSAPPILQRAFSQIAWPQNTSHLRSDVDGLFRELNHLLAGLSDDRLTAIPRRAVCAVFPLLWQHARAHKGAVNAGYLDPFGAQPRDHERFVFFEADNDQVMLLPGSLTAAAACEAIFRLIWKRAGPRQATLLAT